MKRAKETLLDKADRIMSDIGILNDITLNVTDELIAQIIIQKKFNVSISKTDDNRLLFYQKFKNNYNKIILDERGDVSILSIRNDTILDLYHKS